MKSIRTYQYENGHGGGEVVCLVVEEGVDDAVEPAVLVADVRDLEFKNNITKTKSGTAWSVRNSIVCP